jgi:hypothetical protein
MRCLKVRETESIPLVKLSPIVLETGHYDLPDRVLPSRVCEGAVFMGVTSA